jgi:hypothetical protein
VKGGIGFLVIEIRCLEYKSAERYSILALIISVVVQDPILIGEKRVDETYRL